MKAEEDGREEVGAGGGQVLSERHYAHPFVPATLTALAT